MGKSVWIIAENEARDAVEACRRSRPDSYQSYHAHPMYRECVRKALDLMATVPNAVERQGRLRSLVDGAVA